MKSIVEKIKRAGKVILSTHRQCDGDGLGAEFGLYYALKKMGKDVAIVNVDATPKKYSYLKGYKLINYYPFDFGTADLALIFDTNDPRMLGDLYDVIEKNCDEIIFVDHHPVLKTGPAPTTGSFINTSAASTGEIAFHLIKELGVPLDADIAQAIYTSIVFDTQLFRYIRNSSLSHLIAAELLQFQFDTEEVHRRIFGNQTPNKIAFLAHVLNSIEYFAEGRVALIKIDDQDLVRHGLEMDETRDIIDMIMNIEVVEAAILFREDGKNQFKMSLRSKGRVNVLPVAEILGGGGHPYSAGAYIVKPYSELKKRTVQLLMECLREAS